MANTHMPTYHHMMPRMIGFGFFNPFQVIIQLVIILAVIWLVIKLSALIDAYTEKLKAETRKLS